MHFSLNGYLGFLNKSGSFYWLIAKKKFTAAFKNKMFGSSPLGKLTDKTCFTFSENTNNHGCHGNLHLVTLRERRSVFSL